jgi:hypothetical protein
MSVIPAPALKLLTASSVAGLPRMEFEGPLWRVVLKPHSPLAWDERAKFGSRFSPVFQSARTVCGVMYAGDTHETALAETLFRMRARGRGHESRSSRNRELAAIEFKHTLTLLDLDATKSHRQFSEGTIHALTMSPQTSKTRLWAQYLFDHVDEADGIRWRSRQYSRGLCYLIWNRPRGKTLAPQLRASLALDSEDGRRLVLDVASQFGCVLNEAFWGEY